MERCAPQDASISTEHDLEWPAAQGRMEQRDCAHPSVTGTQSPCLLQVSVLLLARASAPPNGHHL